MPGGEGTAIDDEALALRRRGRSFVAIAKALKLGRPQAANAAFNRALRRRPPAEQEQLRDEELARLAKLEAGVHADADLAPFDRDRRLDVVRQLRGRLLATPAPPGGSSADR